MSYFVGVENAKTSEKLPYIQPGRYELRVELIKCFSSRSKGPMFVAEYTVLSSEGPLANAPGERVAHLMKLSNDATLGNIKGLVKALTGDAKVNQKMCDAIVAEDNPSKGTKVKAFAYFTKTKAGTDYTLVQYEPTEETMNLLHGVTRKNAPSTASKGA